MGVLSNLSNLSKDVIEELQVAAGEPDVRSVDHETSTTIRSSNVDKHTESEKKLDRYWELYKNVPIIRTPIRSFAQEIVAPGYYVDTDSEEAREDLEEWLSKCAVLAGEEDKDFGQLIKKVAIQREVKGTALIEKVYSQEDGDKLYGFKPMPPETVQAYTYPNQSYLLEPDADVEDDEGYFDDGVYTTQDGEVAAYVQKDYGSNSLSNRYKIPFTKNDIIKLERDADIGEIFGNSRLIAVEDRLESLIKKLEDNDKAIESLAHPFQLFKFGTDEPWEPAKIQSFANEHKDDDFEPGMKQFVQGDIDVDTVSGEVAPIEEFLQFDINWIISEMPLPKYALGGFEEDVNQFVSRSQETRVEQQITEAREEIIEEWTPVLQDKAEELGYSDDVELVIGTPPEEQVEMPDEEGDNTGASGTSFERPPASTEESRQQNEEQNNEQPNGEQ